MIRRIFTLSCFVALVVVVGYLYHYNSQEIVLVLGPESQLETRAAHAIIALFLAGFLVCSLFTMLISIRHHFAYRTVQHELQREREQQQLTLQARNFLALKDPKQAEQLSQKALQKTPKDPTPRIMLAKARYALGEKKRALEILEQMRIDDQYTVESLSMAADLNHELGNQTAAFDNTALLLARVPGNAMAISQAVRVAAALGRYEEAIDLQKQLVHRARGDEYDAAQKQLARLKVRQALHLSENDHSALQSRLEAIVKEHRDFPEALTLLAEIEEAAGRRDTATKLRKKLFLLTGDSLHLETIARCWLAVDRPDTALAQVEAALAASHGKQEGVEAQLFLAYLQLHLEMLDQARATLAKIEPLVQGVDHYDIPYALLKAKLMRRDQDLASAFAYLLSVIDTHVPLPTAEVIKEKMAAGAELESWAQRLSAEIQSPAPL